MVKNSKKVVKKPFFSTKKNKKPSFTKISFVENSCKLLKTSRNNLLNYC